MAWNVEEQGALVDVVIDLKALHTRCNALTFSTTVFFKEIYDRWSLILLTHSLFVESTLETVSLIK